MAATVAVVALAGAWMQWQPQRSANEVVDAVESGSNAAAFAHARTAVASDPLAVEPRFLLASLYQSIGEAPAARAQLQNAIRSQPENPATWAHLGAMELQARAPQQALAALQHAVALDHTSDPTTRTAAAQIAQAQTNIAQIRSAAAQRRRSTVKHRRRPKRRGQAAKTRGARA